MHPFRLILLFPFLCCAPPPNFDPQVGSGARGQYPIRNFVSSKAQAPHVNFLRWSPECEDGLYFFITPRGWKVKEPTTTILDGNGELVWSHFFANQYGGQAYDFRVQTWRGEDYLTFWLGDDTVRGHGFGKYYMLNSSYDIVREVGAANGLYADLHDFVITPEGTALLTIFDPIHADVRPLGRKFSDVWNQAVWDCLVQEINVESGELLFEWRASEHVNMTHTYSKLELGDGGTSDNPFDWFHINSVEKDELGNFLVSSRNLHAVLYIDGSTKDVIWTLGGYGNDFEDTSGGQALNFAWQHDARFQPMEKFDSVHEPLYQSGKTTTKLLTIFDNAALDWNYEYGPPYSRGLLVELTYPTGREAAAYKNGEQPHSNNQVKDSLMAPRPLSDTDREKVATIQGTNPSHLVHVVREYINPEHILSSTQGSVQVLSQEGSNISKLLIGYGINAVWTEFAMNGSVICNAHFAAKTSWETGDVQSYRVHKSRWIGRPRERPSVAIRRNIVYVSWNGATECHEWVLQASDDSRDDSAFVDVAQVSKDGFETAIPLQADQHFLRVVALDDKKQLMQNGISDIVRRNRLGLFLKQRLGIMDGFLSSTTLILLLFSSISSTILYGLYRRHRGRRPNGRHQSATRHLD